MRKVMPIEKIAAKLELPKQAFEFYGHDKAKIDVSSLDLGGREDGDVVLVTAITPTKTGEGKTTMSIALADGLNRLGEKALLCLREPSLGPVFGLKGGATGGGKASVVPSEDINLHFTGDMHALTSSINLISAIIDNHIYQGNQLNIDPTKIVWHRALDMNDRALRDIIICHNPKDGVRRKEKFQITVASELMAILCLSENEEDFFNRINNIIVAYSFDSHPIYLRDLKISHAIMKLMKKALKPNLVQTLEGNPVLIHGGPFANIAHGCNSLIATKLAMKLAPIVVTEAGFAADLGAEKFFDIKSRIGHLNPKMAVLVASIKALKLHGGANSHHLDLEDVPAMLEGAKNLEQHYQNLLQYHIPVLIAINHFKTDSRKEIKELIRWCEKRQYEVTFVDSYLKGSLGAIDFAQKVKNILSKKEGHFKPLYDLDLPLTQKIDIIAKEIYHADGVTYTKKAKQNIEIVENLGYQNIPICIAKTPLSFSDNQHLLNVPKKFKIHVRDVYVNAGAGFVVCLTGKVLTMPGLPKIPAAVKME
ncbi:MAG: formate--tetrahydrofolate ligase [Bacilli bacterium]